MLLCPVINSEVHHLGYKGTEAYGITWKVFMVYCTFMHENMNTMPIYLSPVIPLSTRGLLLAPCGNWDNYFVCCNRSSMDRSVLLSIVFGGLFFFGAHLCSCC